MRLSPRHQNAGRKFLYRACLPGRQGPWTVDRGLLAVLVFSLFFCGDIRAQEDVTQLAQASVTPAVTAITAGMQERVSLDLRNIEIIEALKFLALKAEINIVSTKNVTGRVTLMVQDVPVKDIFDIMLRSNGLAYVKEGEIFNVMTEDEYQKMYGRNFSDFRDVKVFRLQYAIPEQAFALIDTLKSTIGRVLVESDSGTVLVMDTPESIRKIERALAELEKKNVVRIFTLKYALAKDVEEKLKLRLDAKGVGSVKADERSNQVIIQALPNRIEEIEELIAALDKKTKEVLIDAKIVKVKLSDETASGINWEGLFKVAKHYGMTYIGSAPFGVVQAAGEDWLSRDQFLKQTLGESVGGYPSSGYTETFTGQQVSPGEAIHVGMIDKNRDFDILIKYLNTLGNTQILSNPRLSVINNQEARILVGERQAYVTTTTTTGQATSTVSEDVTFIDVGIQLSVTPTINDDGYIIMKIKPEISSVVSTLVTPSGNKIPIIDTSTAETTVLVKDGCSVVIGGLSKNEKVTSSEGIPFLSKIPIIGFPFKTDSSKVERTELLVLLTPYIISGDMLTTGDDRIFGFESPTEYKEYTPFTAETDLQMPGVPPEDKVRPYKDYSPVK